MDDQSIPFLILTEQRDRTNRLGRLMAMSFFGQFLGSLILTIMINVTLVRNIFIFAAVICGLSIVVIITLLQDSLTDRTGSAGKTSVIVCKYDRQETSVKYFNISKKMIAILQ